MEEPSFPAAGIRRTGKEPKWAAGKRAAARCRGPSPPPLRAKPATIDVADQRHTFSGLDSLATARTPAVAGWVAVCRRGPLFDRPGRPARRPWVQWGSEPNVLPHKVMANLDGLGCHAYICTDWQQREHCWRCRGDGVRVGSLTRTVGIGHHHDNVGRITTVKVASASRPASGDASSTGRPEINAPVLS
jgi:hypothetical protein